MDISQIGPYSIVRELGRGGMGVVYLAHDERLDRNVAIKALPPHLGQDPERLARFEREAKVLAQLNHPNVAGIYGLEESEGAKFLVLEYVEGDTLASHLDRGALPMDESLDVAVQIASGLEAAHDAGVVHRDLKPGNIIITPDGRAKVLDFGLARTDEVSSSAATILDNSPTITATAGGQSPTQPGVILGTAAYMSPEQARGRRVDKRADIWSFGVVLYEMLTGASPFVGETVSDSIGAVLHKQIDLDLLPPGVPVAVRRVISRCVERDKDQRYRDIGDVRIELLRGRDEPRPESSTVRATRRPQRTVMNAAILALVAAAGWFAAQALMRAPEVRVRKFDVMSGTKEQPLDVDCPQISPDGTRLAYIEDNVIYVRDFSSFESRPMAGTDGAKALFWSPDSEWIGYITSDAVYKVGLLGGGAVKVASVGSEISASGHGGWTADDRIVFSTSDNIMSFSARGGSPSALAEDDAEKVLDFHECSVVAGTNVVLFIEHRLDSRMAIMAYDGKTHVEVTVGDDKPLVQPSYSPTGHVMFVRGYRERSLWAIGFDPVAMKVTSEPFLVMPDAGDASISNDGTLVVYRGSEGIGGQLVWAKADGAEPNDAEADGIELIGEPFDVAIYPMLSPDDKKIALVSGELSKADVWVYDLERGSRSRLTFIESTFANVAGWSPDGRELAVGFYNPTGDSKLTTRFYAADGSGETREKIEGVVRSFDAEWHHATMIAGSIQRDSKVSYIELDDPGKRTQLFDSDFVRSEAILNPAATLVAFVSRESGEAEIYCTRFPDKQGRWQISTDGGAAPQWSADGKVLYFLNREAKTIYAVDVTTDPTVQFGMPRLFLDGKARNLQLNAGWSVSADGKRVVALLGETENSGPDAISVIENWYEEYRKR
ncbi:MAG: hypothetical protein DHS20C16_17100 [Phycisphaerae bacterium]|nr:MAG: hypothetical protein DHS20C16_17100 [Phycisphaerae bacterium]